MTDYLKMAGECMDNAAGLLRRMEAAGRPRVGSEATAACIRMDMVTELLAKARNYLDRAGQLYPGADAAALRRRLQGLRAERRKHACI